MPDSEEEAEEESNDDQSDVDKNDIAEEVRKWNFGQRMLQNPFLYILGGRWHWRKESCTRSPNEDTNYTKIMAYISDYNFFAVSVNNINSTLVSRSKVDYTY